MKLLIYSDLHTEINDFNIPPEALRGIDGVVLAGDIGISEKASKWIQANVRDIPTIWVWGNHEMYKGHWERTRVKEKKFLIPYSNIRILENEVSEISGVRFLGTTLWTDCKIRDAEISTFSVMQEMTSQMRDYRKIRYGTGYRRLRVADTIDAHIKASRWLEKELAKHFDGPTVVITHHGPHKRCLNDLEDPYLDGAYASDMSALIEKYGPNLWVYGHTHKAADFMIGKTRLVSNPLGYLTYGEQTGFDPYLTIEV